MKYCLRVPRTTPGCFARSSPGLSNGGFHGSGLYTDRTEQDEPREKARGMGPRDQVQTPLVDSHMPRLIPPK